MNSPKSSFIHQQSIITFNPQTQRLHQCPNCNCQNNHTRQSILKQPTSIYTRQELHKQNKSIISLHGRSKRQRSKRQQRISHSKIQNSILQSRYSDAQILRPKQSYSVKQIQQQQSLLKQERPLPNSPTAKLTINDSRISIQDHFQRKQQNYIKRDNQAVRFIQQQKLNYNPLISNQSNISIYNNEKPYQHILSNPTSIYNAKIFFSPPSHTLQFNKNSPIQGSNYPSVIRFRSSSPRHKQMLSPNNSKKMNLQPTQINAPIEQEPPKPKILFKNSNSPKNSKIIDKTIKIGLQQPIIKAFDNKQLLIPVATYKPLLPNESIQENKNKIDEASQSQIRQSAFKINNDIKQTTKTQKEIHIVSKQKKRYSQQVKTVKMPKVYKEDLLFSNQSPIHELHKQLKNMQHQINSYNDHSDSITKNNKVQDSKQSDINKIAHIQQHLEIQIPQQLKQTQFEKQSPKKIANIARYTQQSIQLVDSNAYKKTSTQDPQPSQAVSSQDQMTTLGKILYKQQLRNVRVSERNRSKSSEEKITKQSKSPKMKASIFKPVAQASNFQSSQQTVVKEMVHELKLYYDYYSGANKSQQSVDISSGKSNLQQTYIAKNNGDGENS